MSLALAPTSNPLFGAKTPPSPVLMMVVLAVPCVTFSVVLCKAVRILAAIFAEAEPQLVGYPAPDQ